MIMHHDATVYVLQRMWDSLQNSIIKQLTQVLTQVFVLTPWTPDILICLLGIRAQVQANTLYE